MASCKSGQAIEKAQNGNGQLLEKVGMDLGLAPLPLGFRAACAWARRHVGLGLAFEPAAPRGVRPKSLVARLASISSDAAERQL